MKFVCSSFSIGQLPFTATNYIINLLSLSRPHKTTERDNFKHCNDIVVTVLQQARDLSSFEFQEKLK